MADWDNSRFTYAQVLAGGTGVYYQMDDKLRYSVGVKTMQTKLNSANYNCGTPDGKFGSGTDTAVRNFQRAKGLTVDGKAGKDTLVKLDGTSTGGGSSSAASKLKQAHGSTISTFASQNGIDVNVLGGFILVESSGSGFVNGLLKIRLENHKFVGKAAGDSGNYFKYGSPTHTGHYYRKNTTATWIQCHTSQTQEHDAFDFAKTIDSSAAYWSTSMGLAQIMGFNYAVCNYSSAKAMYDDFSKGESQQITGFCKFIANYDNGKLLAACKSKDYYTMGNIYNGDGSTYGPKLEAATSDYKNA